MCIVIFRRREVGQSGLSENQRAGL
jgi:hypothetical protein